MEIGPLEYLVIGLQNGQFTSDILPELTAIQQQGFVRVVELLFVTKSADGTVSVQEVSELSEEEQYAYIEMAEQLGGLLTAEDVEKLGEQMPAESKAVILVLEHLWTLQLAQAIHRAGGVIYMGGMVAPEALSQVSAELSTMAKEEHHA